LRSCVDVTAVDAAVNDFGSCGRHGLCRECGSWGRHGRCRECGSWRMHGRNRTVTPATFAHIKMRRLRKFSSCLALRHASWRAISQRRPGHGGDGNDRDNADSSFQLAPLFRVFPVLKKRSPGQLGRGHLSRLFRPCCLGDKRPWSQTRSAGLRTRAMQHRPMPRV
jgi:hypothetical protein